MDNYTEWKKAIKKIRQFQQGLFEEISRRKIETEETDTLDYLYSLKKLVELLEVTEETVSFKAKETDLSIIPVCTLVYQYLGKLSMQKEQWIKAQFVTFEFDFQRDAEMQEVYNIIMHARAIQNEIQRLTEQKGKDTTKLNSVSEKLQLNFKSEKCRITHQDFMREVEVEISKEKTDLVPICKILSIWISQLEEELLNDTEDEADLNPIQKGITKIQEQFFYYDV